jgi:hypothetical protein
MTNYKFVKKIILLSFQQDASALGIELEELDLAH